MTGYSHSLYVRSLEEFGTPRTLPNSRGALLVRSIGDTGFHDAMGTYPMFFCTHWADLSKDFHQTCDDLVSISLVTDPFGDYDVNLLESTFDKVFHFKDHYVTCLSKPITDIVKKSHRATIRRAQKRVKVRLCENPVLY